MEQESNLLPSVQVISVLELVLARWNDEGALQEVCPHLPGIFWGHYPHKVLPWFVAKIILFRGLQLFWRRNKDLGPLLGKGRKGNQLMSFGREIWQKETRKQYKYEIRSKKSTWRIEVRRINQIPKKAKKAKKNFARGVNSGFSREGGRRRGGGEYNSGTSDRPQTDPK